MNECSSPCQCLRVQWVYELGVACDMDSEGANEGRVAKEMRRQFSFAFINKCANKFKNNSKRDKIRKSSTRFTEREEKEREREKRREREG